MTAASAARLKREGVAFKRRLFLIYGVLAFLNLEAWSAAFVAFHTRPALLGVGLVVYGLGMRHAVDADHIAAIDNVTRKLIQDGQRPVSVGFFFALGHSAIVVLVSGALVTAATVLGHLHRLQAIGGTIGTTVSAAFLLALAVMNIIIFRSIWRTYRRVRAGGTYVDEDLDILLNSRGLLSRLFRPLFKLVTRSWHMVLLGFLFGLGFDTATEVAVFGVTATQAAHGVPIVTILVFPVLFAAGMALVDTTDGVVMLGAYEWAFVRPMRKLVYNMTITLVSVLVALLIGGVEALQLIGVELRLEGGVWGMAATLTQNFNTLGFAIIGVFLAAWLCSYAIYRIKKLDAVDLSPAL